VPSPASDAARVPVRFLASWLPLALCAFGTLIVAAPMLGSGFRDMLTDPGDSLLNAYLLEHSWLWLTGGPGQAGFWSPAMGYPASGTLAYSDAMVGFGPPYWLFRALGSGPLLSMQLWMITVPAIGFFVTYGMLRRAFAFSSGAAAAGAFLFAFGAPRLAQIGHQQLLPVFYLAGAFWSLAVLFGRGSGPRTSRRTRRVSIMAFFACTVLQFYGGFYMGYFLVLACAVGLAWALALRSTRAGVVLRLREHAVFLCGTALVASLALAPLAWAYWSVAAEIGTRAPGVMKPMLPRLASYFFVTPWSWLYGWMGELPPFRSLPQPDEHALGMGLVTSGILAWVSWRQRARPAVRIGLFTAATLVLLLTMFPAGIYLHRVPYYVIPGMSAIRAVSRIGLLLLLPAGLALAWWIDRVPRPRSRQIVVWGVVGFCLLEQGVEIARFDKQPTQAAVTGIVEAIEPSSEAFIVTAREGGPVPSYEIHIRAMLAQQRSGVPTLNLYSGNSPKGWGLAQVNVQSLAERCALEFEVARWARAHALDEGRIQRIETRGGEVIPVAMVEKLHCRE